MIAEQFSDFKIEVWMVCLFFILYVINCLLCNVKSNLPPGPIGLPIVGYFPFLSKNVHLNFKELGEKYGEVISLRMGSALVVILNGTDAIKEAFGKYEFLGRPPSSSFSLLANKSPFFDSELNVWKEQRRFAIQALKKLGLGESITEGHIQEEIRCFLEFVKSKDGKPFDLMGPLTPSIFNNVGALVYGHRYDYDHPDRILFDESINILSKALAQTSFHIFFPWIRHIPFLMKWFNLDKVAEAANRSDSLLIKKIDEHRTTLEPGNNRDFIDSYLVEMASRKEQDPHNCFTYKTLVGTASDLLGAGSETVRTTISWCVYIMAAFPDIQKKVQTEIFEVLGPDKNPDMQDQKFMPYTHAVLLEIARWKTVIPLSALRYTTANTTVQGFFVPKNTVVIANFWAVHHNPKNWENPDKFIPERFLSPDKKTVIKPIDYMPFSIGKKSCPGENMANKEMFLYFVSILQKFNIQFPEGEKPTFDAELFITYQLKPYKICFVLRNL